MAANQLICPEREYLEKVYIDFLRTQHPTLDLFREFANASFQEHNYQVYDSTKDWPRDVRVCLIDKLTVSDVIRLARTCRHWAIVILSPSYDTYWRNRHVRDYDNAVPMGPIPAEITIFVKRKKQTLRLLWFHVYQYVFSKRNTWSSSKAALGRRSLKTFLEEKLKVSIPQSVRLPDIRFSAYVSDEDELPVRFYPEWARVILAERSEAAIPDRIRRRQVADAIQKDMQARPEKYFTHHQLPLLNAAQLARHPSIRTTEGIEQDGWALQVPPEAVNRELATLFAPGPLREYFDKHQHKIYQSYFPYHYMQYSIIEAITPQGDEGLKAKWEIAGFRL